MTNKIEKLLSLDVVYSVFSLILLMCYFEGKNFRLSSRLLDRIDRIRGIESVIVFSGEELILKVKHQ